MEIHAAHTKGYIEGFLPPWFIKKKKKQTASGRWRVAGGTHRCGPPPVLIPVAPGLPTASPDGPGPFPWKQPLIPGKGLHG